MILFWIQGEGTGTGGGVGLGMLPTGLLVANGNEIQFIAARVNKGVNAFFEKAPDLIDKYFEKKNEKEKV